MAEQKLSERTMLQVKSQLNTLFKWLTLEEIITTNPLVSVKFKRNVTPKRSRCLLSSNEVKLLLLAAKNFDSSSLYPYLYTLVQTGARRSEIAKLQWDDVDIENGYILFKNTKNGSDRKIKINSALKVLLSNQPKISKFVFSNRRGQCLNRSSIERMVLSFKSVHTFEKNWHLHDLRHSFAYNFLLKGGEMYQLQAILGHRSIQMTVDLYGNLKAHDIKEPSPYNF